MFNVKMPAIFISYRREDSAGVAGRLFDHLRQRFGEKNVFRDIYTLAGGVEFAKDIPERIRGCAVLIALIGKDWLDARDTEGRRRLDDPDDFLAAEISEALNRGKRVIPALIEGASMPKREALPPGLASLADRHALPITDGHFDDDVRRLIGAIEGVISPPDGLPPQELRNRRDLIGDVEREAENRLAQSLHDAALVNLPKEKQPQPVRRPWDVEVKVGYQPSTALPPGTEVTDVFDQEAIAGKLLILGAPGAGKTTTLLQLARDLTARAEADAGAPMPVLVNLSSWKEDNQDLARWLEAELKLKYGLRKDVGKRWLDERCLLPLLDGLDELEPKLQEKCVQAINRFQQEYRPEHLVVCCRLAEYQNCNTKLQLNGAIYLRPLTDEKICNYLVGARSPDLWDSIQADTELLELARSPLLLSMITLAYEERALQQWQKSSSRQELHQYLFDTYVERMLSREVKSGGYPKEKTLGWLAWLARRLKEQGQPEFLIERLQPAWFQSRTQKWIYHIAVVLLVALIFGLFSWLEASLLDLVPKGKTRISEGLAESMGVHHSRPR